jgi:hypothetical protein
LDDEFYESGRTWMRTHLLAFSPDSSSKYWIDRVRGLRLSAHEIVLGKRHRNDLSFLVFEPNAELGALQEVVVF